MRFFVNIYKKELQFNNQFIIIIEKADCISGFN